LKKGIQQLYEPEVKARITADIEAIMAPVQAALDLGEARVNVAKVVDVVTAKVAELTIEIPEIVVLPTQDVTFGFRDFDLTGLEAIAKQPIADEIMVQRLRDETRTYLARSMEGAREERPENYIVRHLMDMPEVDYDSQSELLFKLSGQMVGRLRAYLSIDEDIENVLLVHGKDLARFIFEQMKQHYWETPTDYRATVSRGFQLLRPQAFNVPNENAVRDFRVPVVPAGDTKKQVFGGFRKCCYPYQRFQSGEEREFAVLIDSDNEPAVTRWMKPGAKQFQIEYASGQAYEPDFVVETKTEKLIVEIKAANEIADPVVQAKARAAAKWVGYANAHAAQAGGKKWRYVLVPHDAVSPSATLVGLVARYIYE
jgi:type III restriction enzyme